MKTYKIKDSDVSELSKSLQKFSDQLPESQQALLKTIINFSKDGFSDATSNFSEKLGNKNIADTGFDITIGEDLDLQKIVDSVFHPKAPGISDPVSPVADSIGVGVVCISWSKDYKEIGGLAPDYKSMLKDDQIKNILSEIRNLKGLK